MPVITHTFDQNELDSRYADAELNYSVACDGVNYVTRQFEHGAQIRAFNDQPFAFLQEIAAKLKDGFELYEPAGVELQAGQGARFLACELTKPKKLRQADLKVIREKIEAAYTAERKALYEQHIAAVALETVQRAERAAAKEAELLKQKLIDAAKTEALAVIGAFH